MITNCRASDLEDVAALLEEAFSPSRFESALVRALVENEREIHHWILKDEERVLAYICYSRAFRDGAPIGWHLAPVAVLPFCQRKGYGSELIRETLGTSPIAASAVFVLGNTEYYPRFGFQPVAAPRCPFDPGNTHFMALRYRPGDDFTIGYEKEFETP